MMVKTERMAELPDPVPAPAEPAGETKRIVDDMIDNLRENVTEDKRRRAVPAVAAPAEEMRCSVTNNHCGSDTWATNLPCRCENCQAWLRAATPPPAATVSRDLEGKLRELTEQMGNAGYCNHAACEEYLREAAALGRAEGLEEAAKRCDELEEVSCSDQHEAAYKTAAEAIRALKEKHVEL